MRQPFASAAVKGVLRIEPFRRAMKGKDFETRITNHRSPVAWMNRVLAGEDARGDIDAMTAEQAARERVVVGLRRRDGLDRDSFFAASGFELEALAGAMIREWVARGFAADDGGRIRLTREGLLFSDSLWAGVLNETPA